MTLVLIGLVGGLITGVSPCVLPVLPVVLLGGGSTDEGSPQARRRPYVVVLGLVLSFAVFTLFGSLLLSALHLPDATIRWTGLVVLLLLGIGLLVPQVGHLLERPFYRLPQRALDLDRGGFLLGVALGAVFVPCAGPVLAAITVAGATGHIGVHTIGLTLGFAAGTAVPLLAFAMAGRGMSGRIQAFRRRQGAFRVVSGVATIALAVALSFNLSDVLQRDVPDYTQAVSDKVAQGAQQVLGGDGSLADCEQGDGDSSGAAAPDCGPAPAFAGVSAWLNTPGGQPVTLASLRGKVVLVDFWAYSCINCQRELPHAEAWAKDYADSGLEVIGVHTPEYAFEHSAANVAAGAQRLGLTFPVALDNDYGTWDAFHNQSWPASYLIDAQGRIRHVSVGEGDYSGEEGLIRQLLTDADPGVQLPAATDVADTTPQDPHQSPETYLGSERVQLYGGTDPYSVGTRVFSTPTTLYPETYGLGGTWTIGKESITSGDDAAITLGYHASKVYLDVGGTGTITVTDGGTSTTIDVTGAPNIYTVAEHHRPQDGTATIRLSPGLEAYSFTFG